jgi:hypothetical protein
MCGLNDLARDIYTSNTLWWTNPATGEPIERNVGELLCLVHSEVSECMEGFRKSLMDDHLPHRTMAEVEMADVFIRCLDIAGKYGWDLDGAVAEKRDYNARRKDHQPAARLASGGKKF